MFLGLLALLFWLTAQGQKRAWIGEDSCFGNEGVIDNYLPPNSSFKLMQFTDGTLLKCLNWTTLAFNNRGVGLFIGVQEFDEEYPSRKTQYRIVAYLSTDGESWDPVDASFFSDFFEDKYEAPINSFYLSSAGEFFYLNVVHRRNGGESYFRSLDGKVWEDLKYVSKVYGNITPYHVYTEQNALPAAYGYPSSKLGLFKKTGEQWELADPYLRNPGPFYNNTAIDDIVVFPTFHGRKIRYHGIEDYFFLRKNLYYIPSNNGKHPSNQYTVGRYGKWIEDPNNIRNHQTAPMVPTEVHVSGLNSKLVFALFKDRLFKSNDGGNNFHMVADRIVKLFPMCDDGTLFAFKRFDKRLLRSDDQGQTWQPVSPGAYNNFIPSRTELAYLPDGSILVIAKKDRFANLERVFVLKRGCAKIEEEEPEEPLDFGTTIITHGVRIFPPIGIIETPISKLALAILEKAKKGNLYLYQNDSGRFEKIKSVGHDPDAGEQVLVFDWSMESSIPGEGYTAAAAEALYLALTKLNEDEIPLEEIHFIGHGRGCIVNSLAIERLYKIPPVVPFSVDQMTNLGPYERAHDIDDEHPDYPLFNEFGNKENGVIIWENVYADSYWQNNGKHYAYPAYNVALGFVVDAIYTAIETHSEFEARKFLKNAKGATSPNDVLKALENTTLARSVIRLAAWPLRILSLKSFFEEVYNSSFDSRPVHGGTNFEWNTFEGKEVYHWPDNDPFSDYIGICEAYTRTIYDSGLGTSGNAFDVNIGGYGLSRLSNGQSHRKESKGSRIKDHSYFENFVFQKGERSYDRILGIQNGSFDRRGIASSIPGWSAHGGGKDFALPEESDISKKIKAFLDVQGELIGTKEETAALVCHNCQNAGAPTKLTHNRFFVPKETQSIRFDFQTQNVSKGKLYIEVKDYSEVLSRSHLKNIS